MSFIVSVQKMKYIYLNQKVIQLDDNFLSAYLLIILTPRYRFLHPMEF